MDLEAHRELGPRTWSQENHSSRAIEGIHSYLRAHEGLNAYMAAHGELESRI